MSEGSIGAVLGPHDEPFSVLVGPSWGPLWNLEVVLGHLEAVLGPHGPSEAPAGTLLGPSSWGWPKPSQESLEGFFKKYSGVHDACHSAVATSRTDIPNAFETSNRTAEPIDRRGNWVRHGPWTSGES